jgi:hypothetical protein
MFAAGIKNALTEGFVDDWWEEKMAEERKSNSGVRGVNLWSRNGRQAHPPRRGLAFHVMSKDHEQLGISQ